MFYEKNRLRARTNSTQPTMTDQSQARETDINVIVQRFTVTGRVPGPSTQPIAGVDFTKMPEDFRGFIHKARTLEENRRKLPKELRDMPIGELMALTPEQLTAKLTPPAPSPEPPKEPEKQCLNSTPSETA